jgi:AAA domain
LTPLPLERLRFGWRSHLSALWWLGLLYRRPLRFCEALEALPKTSAVAAGLVLLATAVPYIAAAPILFGLVEVSEIPDATGIVGGIAVGIAGGFALGFALGTASRITSGITLGIAGGFAIGVGSASGIGVRFATVITALISMGVVIGISLRIFSVIIRGIIRGIAGEIGLGIFVGIIGGLAGGMIAWGIVGGGIGVGLAVAFAGGIAYLRAYYLPVHTAFVWPVPHGLWYRFHPVAWDDLSSIPFRGLDRLLIAFVEYAGDAGWREIDRLIDDYPSQRMPALRARTVLVARDMGRETNLALLDAAAARLPVGERGFLAEVPKLRGMIAEIAGQQRRLDTVHRAFLREPLALGLRTQIENFRHQVAGFREPLASEFRAAAALWLAVADGRWHEAEAVMKREPIAQVFRAGDPVDRAQEAFVPRLDVIGQLEGQLTLSTGCPGLVLYGRRRTGKSTALRNLDGFLPSKVRVAAISMQNPSAFTSLAYFARLVMGAITEASTEIPKPTLVDLFEALDSANAELTDQNRRLLLAIDEYENIDEKIAAGVFPLDLLAALRESIQTHRRITWIFAGSHDIAELKHAPWPSYLVSARTIEMPLFSEAETRLLLTEPMSRSPLWLSVDDKRPHFPAGFWGNGGIEYIHREAGGWPHLVQLLAETAVDLANDSTAQEVDAAMLERAAARAIVHGDTVLRQLLEQECAVSGEWEYLGGFRRNDMQPPPEDETVYRSLRRRLLVLEKSGLWRLRVPLMQRWLRERG